MSLERPAHAARGGDLLEDGREEGRRQRRGERGLDVDQVGHGGGLAQVHLDPHVHTLAASHWGGRLQLAPATEAEGDEVEVRAGGDVSDVGDRDASEGNAEQRREGRLDRGRDLRAERDRRGDQPVLGARRRDREGDDEQRVGDRRRRRRHGRRRRARRGLRRRLRRRVREGQGGRGRVGGRGRQRRSRRLADRRGRRARRGVGGARRERDGCRGGRGLRGGAAPKERGVVVW